MKQKRQEKGLEILLQNVGSADINLSKWTGDQDKIEIDQTLICDGLAKLSNVVQRIQAKLKAYSIQSWQRISHSKCRWPDTPSHPNVRYVLERLRRNIQKQHWYSLTQSFHKWRAEASGRINQFRLLALAKSFAVLQISCRIFTAWKVGISQTKLKKRSLMLRAFKNLKTHLRRKKIFEANQILLSSMQTDANLSILEACFDMLRYYCRQKQLKRDSNQSQTIQPQITQLKSEIKQRKDYMDLKGKIRAINALLIAPFSKQLKSVLELWSKNISERARKVRLNVKYLIIKTYKNKLQIAFNRLKAGLSFRHRSGRHGNIDEIHDQNYRLDHTRLQLKREILILADNVKQQGLKQFKELCIKVTQKNLGQWMERWLTGARLKSKQLAASQQMLSRLRKRILRTALQNFQYGFNFYLQDQYNFRRAHEIKRRLAFRVKKRIYMAMATYSNRHNTRVMVLKYLLKTIHRHTLVRAILAWQKFSLRTLESNLLNQEKFEVVVMDRLQNDLSIISDSKNESDQTNQKFKNALLTGASQTLKKWVIRSHLGGQQYGFITWKQKSNKMRHRQILVKYLSRSIESNMCRTVWFRWKQTLILDNRKNLIQSISQKAIDIGNHEQKISFNRQKASSAIQIINKNKVSVNSETAVLSQKAARVVTELIKRRQENIFLSRVRYMFQQWRSYSHNQYRCVVALEKGITKMCLQRAFIQIRNFYQLEFREEIFTQHLKNLLRLKLLLPARQALNKWRTHVFQCINTDIEQTSHQEYQETESQNRKIAQIRSVQLSLRSSRKKENLTNDSFNQWKQVCLFGRMQKGRIQGTRQIMKTFELRRAVHKLRLRTSLTAKYKGKLALFAEKRRKIYLSACFVKSLKFMYQVDKRLANGTAHLVNSIIFSNCLLAFKRIKRHSKIRYEACCSKRQQASQQFCKVLERLRSQRIREALRLISKTAHFNLTIYSKLSQCLNNRSTINARSYFTHWRMNSLKQGVVDFNNLEDGPVNIECWHERMNCRNLVQMVLEDGNPEQDVQLFLQEQKDKFYELGEKTVCRMIVCQDENMRLLPIVLDRLRNYARLRKIWRDKLNYVNGLLEFDRHNIFLRFQRWRNFDQKMRNKLLRTPLKQLQINEDANISRLLHLSDEVQYHDRAILEFKEQKGILFKCFIGSQRLALSSTKSSYERVQQKALLRLSDNGNYKLQSEIGSVIDRNLVLIQQLKERIQNFEQENNRISEQNDQFRFDAVQAVHNAHQVRILKEDNERLQYEVANAAQAFKNLIADNQLLSRYLQEQRIEAKIQLEHTQSLQNQKLAELEQLRQAERLSASSRRGTSLNTQNKVSMNRVPTRSLSPVLQDHSVSVSNKVRFV